MTLEFRYCPLTRWGGGGRGLGLTLFISMIDRGREGVDEPMQIYPIQPRDLQVMHMLSVLSAPTMIMRGVHTHRSLEAMYPHLKHVSIRQPTCWKGEGRHTHSFHSFLNALLQNERLARMDDIDNSRCPNRL
jgi:hypothetical protein